MPAATMTSKGQTTIPAEVRRRLGLEAGDRIDFVEVAEDRFEIRPAHGSVGTLRGFLSQWAGPVTSERVSDDDEIMVAVTEADARDGQ
jgi:AbrB family looped-hinge helix DNA binding protein